ncbi:MAG: Asp-tRNA(Asn)/Glu-tRNA(Gln) amidotransferase subunit GatA [Christensenellales bacterium]|jgi:aspartyl-tRNA(Asn)/glutamyl-tRNA(Gln) amidotransferase subunit A|nr:Asp-tRNA(Asn)/Glu-tRNA(Gln) amidotransferase subunit GatA [Clostridiales bacterium]
MPNNLISLATQLQRKEISSVELTTEYLKKIKKLNKKTNAYVFTNEEVSLSQAKKADQIIAKGAPSVLTGIPMSLKDSIMTIDMPTTACSKMLAKYIPTYNSTVYTKLLNNGAVLLGKTNMDEFSMGSSCLNGFFGEASNPYDTNRVTGGSSGGSAASIAQDTCVYSLGTDAGGSIRQPASYCGIVGFKPTYGAVSRNGLIALASSFEQIGPMAKNVGDTKIIFNVIKGKDEFDQTAFEIPRTTRQNPIIGIDEDHVEKTADKDTLAVFEKAIKACSKLGYKTVKIKSKYNDIYAKLYYILAYAEIASNMGRYTGIDFGYSTKSKYIDTNDFIKKSRSEAFSNEVKTRIMFGNHMLTGENMEKFYYKALKMRNDLVEDYYLNVFSKCDFILSPTTPTAAFRKDYKHESIQESALTNIFALPANLIGLPSISIPFGVSSDNMPIGMLLTGKRNFDNALLSVAENFEKHSGYKVLN